MRTKTAFSVLAPLMALGLPLWFASPATADTIFTLNQNNLPAGTYTPGYISVDVHLVDSNNATVTFTSLIAGGNIFLMGGQGVVGLNVNATSWTLGTLTGSNSGSGFTAPAYSDGGAQNEDGWGKFNQTIDAFDGFTHSANLVVVNLSTTSTWLTSGNVLTANASGHFAAAHIFPTAAPADAHGTSLTTGYATDNGTSTGGCLNGATNPPICTFSNAPEPSSMLIFGGGLLGLATVLRRRRGV